MKFSTHIESDKDIGAKVKQARQKRHITLASLSNRIGIDPAVLSLAEAGITPFSSAAIHKVACALGIGLDEFFSEPSQDTPDSAHILQTKICMSVMKITDAGQLEIVLDQVEKIVTKDE